MRQQTKAETKRSKEIEVQCDLLTLQQLQHLETINHNCRQENEALLLVLQEWSSADNSKDTDDNSDHTDHTDDNSDHTDDGSDDNHSTLASSETQSDSEGEE
jgi:hypothetical protein